VGRDPRESETSRRSVGDQLGEKVEDLASSVAAGVGGVCAQGFVEACPVIGALVSTCFTHVPS
jgi:hypothetical protein